MYSTCVRLNIHCLHNVFGTVCELPPSALLWLSLTGSERPHHEGRDADIGEMLRRHCARVFHCTGCKGGSTLVTLPCIVKPYRDCEPDSCPRNVSKVGYAVTLRAFTVCCRYLAVASKG
jgi:hypothetical protein